MTGTIWTTGMICMIRMNTKMTDDLDDWNGLHDD